MDLKVDYTKSPTYFDLVTKDKAARDVLLLIFELLSR